MCSSRSHANLASATTHAPALADSIPASEYHTSGLGPCGGSGPCATAPPRRRAASAPARLRHWRLQRGPCRPPHDTDR